MPLVGVRLLRAPGPRQSLASSLAAFGDRGSGLQSKSPQRSVQGGGKRRGGIGPGAFLLHLPTIGSVQSGGIHALASAVWAALLFTCWCLRARRRARGDYAFLWRHCEDQHWEQ